MGSHLLQRYEKKLLGDGCVLGTVGQLFTFISASYASVS